MAHLVLDFPDPETSGPTPGPTPGPPSAGPPDAFRRVFRDPVEIVTARDIGEVRPALERIQRATAGGMHAAGYLAYEAAPAFEPTMRVRPGSRMPLVWFGVFGDPEREVVGPVHGSTPPLDWRLLWSRQEYGTALDEARDAIAAGRTYQVNLTTRMEATMRGDPRPLYERMRRAQGGGYHAFLDLGRHAVLSASPELFFRTRGRTITTRPMKGTRRRGRWPGEDTAMAAALASSEKERAENLMIVDLLRNDLGRVCATGTVRTRSLHTLERYPTVWQMTSTVEGELREGVGLTGILDALFPCGSVTGAPKISTMAEIARLETTPREVYCGAIGWVRPGGDCTFSVPIRTAWLDRDAGAIEYGTGGGVVWDSTADDEYDELRAKAVVVRDPWPEFALIETLGLRDGRFVRRDRHMVRLRESAEYFAFPFPAKQLAGALDRLAIRHPTGHHLARLRLHPDGGVDSDVRPLEGPDSATAAGSATADGSGAADKSAAPLPRIVLSTDPVDSSDPFLFHKTTNRTVYDDRRSAAPDAFDMLLQNERGEVTELTRGNLVVEVDGVRVTPARSSGLLAGCLRQELLDAGEVVERVVRREELDRATRLWFINSARGWVEVALATAEESGRDASRRQAR